MKPASLTVPNLMVEIQGKQQLRLGDPLGFSLALVNVDQKSAIVGSLYIDATVLYVGASPLDVTEVDLKDAIPVRGLVSFVDFPQPVTMAPHERMEVLDSTILSKSIGVPDEDAGDPATGPGVYAILARVRDGFFVYSGSGVFEVGMEAVPSAPSLLVGVPVLEELLSQVVQPTPLEWGYNFIVPGSDPPIRRWNTSASGYGNWIYNPNQIPNNLQTPIVGDRLFPWTAAA